MRALPCFLILLAAAAPARAQDGPIVRAGGAWLGVSYDTRWLATGDGCVSQLVVETVVPGSPAERAGVRPGDVVVAIDDDGAPARRLPLLAARLSAGDQVRLDVERSGAARRLIVVADRRPDGPILITRAPAGAMEAAQGPVIEVRGDTLIATNAGGGPAGASGYWLRSRDGRLTFRSLAGRPVSDLDRRAAALLSCARAQGPVMPMALARDVAEIQAQAESLRVVMARRVLGDVGEPGRETVLEGVLSRSPLTPQGEARVRFFSVDDALASALRGVAGADVVAMEPELAEYFRGVTRGLLVLRVPQGTPAARADLRPGDVITGASGSPVATPAALRATLAAAGPDPVELTVVRQGRHRTVTLTRP
jgi:membrane-associated protease RseP (regulator of RpoE activity)